MDRVVDLYRDAVGQARIAQVGTIRAFRHWVAHGRRGRTPPNIAPLFAYQTLTAFLQLAQLI
jgi:hypothetical protein